MKSTHFQRIRESSNAAVSIHFSACARGCSAATILNYQITRGRGREKDSSFDSPIYDARSIQLQSGTRSECKKERNVSLKGAELKIGRREMRNGCFLWRRKSKWGERRELAFILDSPSYWRSLTNSCVRNGSLLKLTPFQICFGNCNQSPTLVNKDFIKCTNKRRVQFFCS